jgi:hypothetical protein
MKHESIQTDKQEINGPQANKATSSVVIPKLSLQKERREGIV